MIQVIDNFLPANMFEALQDICQSTEFKIVNVGGKDFSIMDTPEDLIPFLQIPGHSIILTFIRDAYKGFDNDWRIHADSIISNHMTSLASVLYINDPKGVTPNGTAFWKHKDHGLKLNTDVGAEEFDRLLTDDANDLSNWKSTAVVESEPNRLLTYNSQYFHSKTPNEITEGRRIVLVVFYKKES